MPLESNAFCSVDQLERYMSNLAADLYSTHTTGSAPDPEVKYDAINFATEEMSMFLRQRYDVASLAACSLVQSWCVRVAAYYLSTVRGDDPPEVWKKEYDRLMDPDKGLLAMVAAGKIQLPGVALRSDVRPSMSNLRIDRRYTFSKVRVTRPNSTDQPATILPRKFHDGSYLPDV